MTIEKCELCGNRWTELHECVAEGSVALNRVCVALEQMETQIDQAQARITALEAEKLRYWQKMEEANTRLVEQRQRITQLEGALKELLWLHYGISKNGGKPTTGGMG
jgi:septal ring factor EnvC (AmiA/AmiB activator)